MNRVLERGICALYSVFCRFYSLLPRPPVHILPLNIIQQLKMCTYYSKAVRVVKLPLVVSNQTQHFAVIQYKT